MKALSVAGTVAMFLVGGGILTHGLPWLHHGIEAVASRAAGWPAGAVFGALMPGVLDALTGVITGAVVLLLVSTVSKWRKAA
jgi:hypothetical protein